MFVIRLGLLQKCALTWRVMRYSVLGVQLCSRIQCEQMQYDTSEPANQGKAASFLGSEAGETGIDIPKSRERFGEVFKAVHAMRIF